MNITREGNSGWVSITSLTAQQQKVVQDIDVEHETPARLGMTTEECRKTLDKIPPTSTGPSTKTKSISELYAESMVGHIRHKDPVVLLPEPEAPDTASFRLGVRAAQELPPDAIVGHDPEERDTINCPPPSTNLHSGATLGLQELSDEIHKFDANQQLVLERIMALEADPPPATKPLPEPPTVEYLVSLVKVMQQSQKYLLGRLVALEQGRKYSSAIDHSHPFED
jgi:hypothetical protein